MAVSNYIPYQGINHAATTSNNTDIVTIKIGAKQHAGTYMNHAHSVYTQSVNGPSIYVGPNQSWGQQHWQQGQWQQYPSAQGVQAAPPNFTQAVYRGPEHSLMTVEFTEEEMDRAAALMEELNA